MRDSYRDQPFATDDFPPAEQLAEAEAEDLFWLHRHDPPPEEHPLIIEHKFILAVIAAAFVGAAGAWWWS